MKALVAIFFFQLLFISAVAEKPNVLFIAVDDLKDWVSYMGGYEGKVETPNIDRLAAMGRPFFNAHCPSPKCVPSRCAILSGKRASSLGIYGNGQWMKPNYPDLISLPHYFKKNGYLTVGSGKITHHTAGFNPPEQWDKYQEIDWEDPWDRSTRQNYPFVRDIPRPKGYPFSGMKLRHEFDWGTLPEDLDYHDIKTTDFAVDFLSQSHKKPFFLACGLYRPHLPWYSPKEYFKEYPLSEVKMPPLKEGDQNDLPTAAQKIITSKEFNMIKEKGKYKEAVQAYLAAITFADNQIGRLLDSLQKSPYGKNTIVVLWSDHGWHLGEKQHWHKWTLWEEATRVPFIIAVPNQQNPGELAKTPVNLLDLYPTLIDLCSLPKKEGLEGISLKEIIADPQKERGRPVTIERGKGQSAVRDLRYRLIRYQDGSEELYDLQKDPYEWTNLIEDPQYRKIKEKLEPYLTKEWKAPIPSKGKFKFNPNTYKWQKK